MNEKLLHVSCIVPQAGLYDFLRVLEAQKVGNVEVRPVAPMLMLPAPTGHAKPRRKRRGVQSKVEAAMVLRQKHGPVELASAINENPKSVYSALARLRELGIAKKVGTSWIKIKQEAAE